MRGYTIATLRMCALLLLKKILSENSWEMSKDESRGVAGTKTVTTVRVLGEWRIHSENTIDKTDGSMRDGKIKSRIILRLQPGKK